MENTVPIKDSENTADEARKDEFFSQFIMDDVFAAWLLLDFTRFSVARLRNYDLALINITPEQAAILQILARRHGKATINEISRRWMRRTHSVSTLAHRMEKQGLIKLTKYPHQKTLELSLTEKGQEYYRKINRHEIEKVFSVLTSEQIRSLSKSLHLLLAKARSMLNEIDF